MNQDLITQNDNLIVERVLDALEQREAALLSWGIVEVAEPAIDVAAIADDVIGEFDFDASNFSVSAEVINCLVERGLIFELSLNGEKAYRSRMAETVRLMFHLRQLFPKHAGDHRWQDAPNLVADYRFIWKRRQYPSRDIKQAQALSELTVDIKSPKLKIALGALIKHDLAKFQVAATKKILNTLNVANKDTATLISAGTGSGKTLAFYIPALSKITEAILYDRNKSDYVKSLAIYPRNELLKDQFSEVYREVRRLDELLQQHGKRKIKIATFFGPTPADKDKLRNNDGTYKWRRNDVLLGHICEFLSCPDADCTGDLLWLDTHRNQNIEKLTCSECEHIVGPDEIILTRERLKKECPDILFTTIETLNQRLGDNRWNKLFGVGQSENTFIQTFLLDEVHTYTGQTGAQTGYLIKRWRHMLGSKRKISFVGLSATLSNGPQFIEQLTGVPEYKVDVIAPAWDELIEEGAEYALALRGDPVSKTALLSATIQATMLISRMLDSNNDPISMGLYGSKVFVFGDDIDVIQRLYHAMSDAEGRFSGGNINNRKNPLAMLRASTNNAQRFLNGQDWRHAEDIGHSLDDQDRKHIARVMSMDPGVLDTAEIIVASASLEVGFNDPKAGAVIQHKAPRGVAQFLQRKGRAGRKRGMRPWTIVSLSDYGRDKFAYQSFEHLFDPEIPPSNLPTSSRYIKRMQMVYATIDYLSLQVSPRQEGSIWTNLWQPSSAQHTLQLARKATIQKVIRGILSDANHRSNFTEYLSKALQLDIQEVEMLCWEQPRPLFLEVFPTILRRLEKNWETVNESNRELPVINTPLPEFIPATFFKDLEQADVKISIRDGNRTQSDDWNMNLPQMLREFAPFRVSKRYAMRSQSERYWLPAQLNDLGEYEVELGNSFDFIQKGQWWVSDGGQEQATLVCQPTRLLLDVPDSDITDTSNALPIWKSQLVAKNLGDEVEVSTKIAWSKFIPKITFHMHTSGAPIEARRMSIGSDATIKRKNGSSTPASVRFKHNEKPAALGFTQQVDAIKFDIRLPEVDFENNNFSPEFLRAVRTYRFFYDIEHSQELAAVSNPFVKKWLATLTYSCICIEALSSKISTKEAICNLTTNTATVDLSEALQLLFQSKVIMSDLASGDDNDTLATTQDTLRSELEHWINNNEVIDTIWDHSSVLTDDLNISWRLWLDNQFVSTLAAALTDAVQNLCPDFDVSNLIVDIGSGVLEEQDVYYGREELSIWLSESAPGGVGQIEDFVLKYSDDPRRFFDLLSFSLSQNDLQSADKALFSFIDLLTSSVDQELLDIVGKIRTTVGNGRQSNLQRDLRKRLNEVGLRPFHAFNVALNNRVLRVGSSQSSDYFFKHALEYWDASELSLGLELDARLVAYCLARTEEVEQFFGGRSVDTQTLNDLNWRFSTCYSLLWSRSGQVRKYGLSLYSRYAQFPEVDPIFVTEHVSEVLTAVDVMSDDWLKLVQLRLSDTGSVIISAPENKPEALNEALNVMATNPVITGYLSAYCRIGQIRKVENKYLVTLDLAEVML